ncbi:alpha-L-fucosidase [Cephus cinctus]|uniref:Putative alpha-L-fucosidase n=1 Tax=Cephus cinctus TaxID=211228 RepID=A0AAJ7BHF4_CEPCN|nr:alpha-L-fucosidase [Cephus cinctus]
MSFWIFLILSLNILCDAQMQEHYLISMVDESESFETFFQDGRMIMKKYKPTWESLDSRPLPQWYDDAKFGIFIHWGVFSVPSFGSEWFWNNWKDEKDIKYHDFMEKNYPPNFTYQEFAKDFTAEFFNATQWSELFEASGAKYVVLTSKHHEGYTLWPSKYSFSWNSVDVGPHRNLIGELANAIRKETNLKFGLYHSLYEWYNPLYLHDKENNFTTDIFATQKTIPELHELIDLFKPEVIWSDGDWEPTDSYWKSKEFLAWLYNDSPIKDTVVVNDRWGMNIPCNHGDFYTCTDRYNPGVLQAHKWENCMTIDRKSWGYRRNAVLNDYLTLKELVKELIVSVSCGGNLLMNVGPTKDGIIAPIFEERLRGMGKWLALNGEAIYNSKPWSTQNDTLNGDVWYTQSKNRQKLYANVLSWPIDNILQLGSIMLSHNYKVFLLGHDEELVWKQESNSVKISLPANHHRGQPAWVLRINFSQ